jgi:hypothetical protein
MRERWWAGCCYSTSTCFGSAAAGGGGCAVGSRHCGPAACVVAPGRVSAHDAAQAAARDGRRRRRAEAAQAVGGACVELFPGRRLGVPPAGLAKSLPSESLAHCSSYDNTLIAS